MPDPRVAYRALDSRLFVAHRASSQRVEHQRIGRDFAEQLGLEVLQGFYPSSALVFITDGPYAATGSRMGLVASSVE